jgi:NADPH-dependent ferric siderophore reductase
MLRTTDAVYSFSKHWTGDYQKGMCAENVTKPRQKQQPLAAHVVRRVCLTCNACHASAVYVLSKVFFHDKEKPASNWAEQAKAVDSWTTTAAAQQRLSTNCSVNTARHS